MAAVTAGGPEARDGFVADTSATLQRALVARYGFEVGREAAADATVWALEHWDEVASMTNPVGYLYRVGQSAARRHLVRRRPGLVVTHPVTEAVVDVDLQRAVMGLNPAQRVAVLLVHGFGYRYQEVAELLDVPVTTVTNHVHRGLARLRAVLERS